MSDFSMDLNEDQITLRDWVHGFAEQQMRPIAAEWDEREETPWAFIQEAAKLGVYGLDFMMNAVADPTGLSMMIALEELAWGDAGLCMSLMGTSLGVAAILSNGTREQQIEWIPQCYGTPDDVKIAAFGVSEPDAGSDVSSLRTRAVYDEANDEWVLNGTKTWITNGGIANVHVIVASVDPTLGARGQASFIIPDGTPGLSMGQKFKKMGIRASHTAEVILDDCRVPGPCLLGGKEKLDEKLARVREGKRSTNQAAMATFEATRPAVGAQALGIARAAYEFALGLRQRTQAVWSGHHREPGHRLQVSQHEDERGRFSASHLARGVDGGDPQALYERRRFDVQALRQRNGGQGDRRGDTGARAAMATCATIRSNAGTGTRRSTPSSKEPQKFSV